VIWSELNTFYSIYFLFVGILSSFPELSTAPASEAILPLLIVIGLEYLLQAYSLFTTARAARLDDRRLYSIVRDTYTRQIAASAIIPGDLIEITNQGSVPCDCILLLSDEFHVFINTSKVDGETEIKARAPLRLPGTLTSDVIKQNTAILTAPNPATGTRDVSGRVSFEGAVEIGASFDANQFMERGSIIESTGTHLLAAVYTGVHCRSDASVSVRAARKTLIDQYLETLALFVFLFQVVVALILGSLGYRQAHNSPVNYVPRAYQLVDIGNWKWLVFVVRNFLLLSCLVPITLKFLLPVFRFIYGVFITEDLSFLDTKSRTHAKAFSTSITENLGALNVIVSDKTGTLTKNKLTLRSLTVEDAQYGMTKKAASLIEDEVLHKDFAERQSPDFLAIFQALSLCHSVKINERQELFGPSSDEIGILTSLKKLGWRFDTETSAFTTITSPIGPYRARIVRINPFDRERMMMSVVVEIQGETLCFMKGAPERVIRQCTTHSGPLAAHFDEYQRMGLRTFAVSCKKIANYSDAMSVDELESEHRLLGTLGIEDALGQDVQVTIDLLSDAGLKIWVATGDAQLNTIATAAALRLLRQGEPVVDLRPGHIYAEGPGAPLTDFSGFSDAALASPRESFSVLVDAEDSDGLAWALTNPKFVKGLYRARCVVFYRCKPTTKADVAVALQTINKKVMGVGDGANDSVLLRTADVGIGILGKSGAMAFANCDFAIPTFTDLGRLILVHGHTALHRSVLAVNFSFYKAMLFGACQILYQYWTDWTWQSFFDGPALMAYNNVWTLLPLISLLFERDIGENFLYRLSRLYKKLRDPLTIKPSNLTWFFSAVFQGFVSIAVVYLLTGEAFISAEGKDYGHGYLSIVVYTGRVFIAAFYMAYQTNTFTYYSILLILGNVNLLIAFTACLQSENFLSSWVGTAWIGFFGECLNAQTSLVLVATMVLAAVTPSWVGLTIWAEYTTSDALRVIEMETIASKEDQPLFFDPPKDR
jgi:phospholipid-translocating ATPase